MVSLRISYRGKLNRKKKTVSFHIKYSKTDIAISEIRMNWDHL